MNEKNKEKSIDDILISIKRVRTATDCANLVISINFFISENKNLLISENKKIKDVFRMLYEFNTSLHKALSGRRAVHAKERLGSYDMDTHIQDKISIIETELSILKDYFKNKKKRRK